MNMKYVKKQKTFGPRPIPIPKYQKQLDDVEYMYLHKGWIIKSLVENILKEIKPKKSSDQMTLYVSEIAGFPEIDEAREHITMSFLRDLEGMSLIEGLTSVYFSERNEPDHIDATFSYKPVVLKKYLDLFLLKLTIRSQKPTLKSIRSDFSVMSSRLYWRNRSIPAGGSQGAVLAELLQSPEIYLDKKRLQNGSSISRKILETITAYDEGTLRDALKELRRKLKQSEFPLSIENTKKNHYHIRIEY